MPPPYYSKDQLKVVLPFLDLVEPGWTPKSLLLGGPADGNEAQCARELWPSVSVLGVEPNRAALDWQLEEGEWPSSARIIHRALSDKDRQLTTVHVHLPSNERYLRVSSLDPAVFADFQFVREGVTTATWDSLNNLFGPFDNALLWMDIEGWEYEACLGALNLIRNGAIRMINVEMQSLYAAKNERLDYLLRGLRFDPVHDWNASETCRDRIYVRRAAT